MLRSTELKLIASLNGQQLLPILKLYEERAGALMPEVLAAGLSEASAGLL